MKEMTFSKIHESFSVAIIVPTNHALALTCVEPTPWRPQRNVSYCSSSMTDDYTRHSSSWQMAVVAVAAILLLSR
jgi:hypothetical protein